MSDARDRRPAQRAVLIAAGCSAAFTALAIVTIDRPLARLLADYEPHPFWNQAIELLEWTVGLPVFRFFSSVLLVALMLAAVAIPRLRAHAPPLMLIAGTHVISRFLTTTIKDATGRVRPGEWLENQSPSGSPSGDNDTFFHDGIAFPSGHVALFASIAIPLAIVYPRTRPLLGIVAFVMIARVAVNGHWVSDVIGAIALVTLVAWSLSLLVRPLRTG